MSIRDINEAFKRMCEAPEFADVADPSTDLRSALEAKMYALMDAQEANIKAYEIGFQDVIESFYPDKAWWEVTDVDIFQHLFMNRNPAETLEAIVTDVESKEEPVEEAMDNEQVHALKEALEGVLSRLNEAPTSPEDKYDSDLIRSMLDKMQIRSNHAFTPEEQAVMRKYGIKRDNNGRNLEVAGVDLAQPVDKMSHTLNWGGDKYSNGTKHKINYADRARKIPDRMDNQPFGHPRFYASNADVNAHGGGRTGHDNLLDAQRSHQAAVMGQPVSQMKRALSDRKYHKNIIDRSQADYDAAVAKAKADYDRAMSQAERSRADRPDGYHMTSLNHANKTIDTLLNKEPKTESMETSGYFKVTYDSNGVASAVMVKANSEEEARKVYNDIKGSKFPTIYGVVELYPTEVETSKKKGMSCLN